MPFFVLVCINRITSPHILIHIYNYRNYVVKNKLLLLETFNALFFWHPFSILNIFTVDRKNTAIMSFFTNCQGEHKSQTVRKCETWPICPFIWISFSSGIIRYLTLSRISSYKGSCTNREFWGIIQPPSQLLWHFY